MENNNQKPPEIDADRENAKSFVHRIGGSVQIISSQINYYSQRKEDLLKSFGIGNGIIAGLTLPLLSSNIPKNTFLLFIGLGLLFFAEIYWVFHARKFIVISKPYIQHLSDVNKKMSKFSSLYNKFLRGDRSLTYEEITNKFLSDENYSDMHDSETFKIIEEWTNKEIKNDTKINVLTSCFVFGLISIFLSLLFPYFKILLCF
ncbi:MAG: hypothetical protein WC587_02145 [Candidatus Paceibacterota bacterium]